MYDYLWILNNSKLKILNYESIASRGNVKFRKMEKEVI